jgi:hypothetical protein
MGILKIFIDQMETPFMTTFINLGEMIKVDEYLLSPRGTLTGKGYVSIAASTTNSANTNIQDSRDANSQTKFRTTSPNEFEFTKSDNSWWLDQTQKDALGNFESYS